MRALIQKLADNNISLSVVDENIKVRYWGEGNISSDIVAEIRSHKEELLTYLTKYALPGRYERIEPVPPAPDYAVSDGQRRLWITSQLPESSRAYNMFFKVGLGRADCKFEYLEKAFGRIMRRHEILRTVFLQNAQGELRQRILPFDQVSPDFRQKHLEGATQEEVQHYLQEESRHLFDLGAGPLIFAGLIRCREDENIVYLNMHHIVSDGVSLDILSRELLAYYAAFVNGMEPSVKPLRIQYKDYALWQHRQLETERFAGHRAYWAQQLEGELPVISLSSSKPRPAVLTHRGSSLTAAIDGDLTAKLKAFCIAGQGTLFMGLITVFKCLAYRYTGARDIIIGIPVAGRDHAELEDQVGFYVNTLPLRTRFGEAESFAGLFDKVKKVTMEGYLHQEYPFNRLVEELSLQRDMSRSPVFDISLVFQNQQSADSLLQVTMADKHRILEGGPCQVKFDLIVSFSENSDVLYLQMEFNTDVYERSVMEGVIRHFKALLALAMADPQQCIGRCDYLTVSEREEILGWGRGKWEEYGVGRTVVDWWREAVSRHGEKVAVECGGSEWSYRELEERSNRLSRYLIRKGVRPGMLVGICVERSLDLVGSIWGVLKSGAGYVPLDPGYPAERIRGMMEDSGAGFIITQSCYKELLGELVTGRLYLDRDEIAVEMESGEGVRVEVGEELLAYVMYTSGSTGKPKGVMISHGQLYNYVSYSVGRYMCGEEEEWRVPLFTSMSFDLTVTSFFGSVLSGGRLVVYGQELGIGELVGSIFGVGSGINFVKCTPSHLELLRELGLDRTGVKRLVVGGEELKGHHLRLLEELNGGVVVYNEYGPTEATVGCIVEEWRGGEGIEELSIGRPISNMGVYILDGEGSLVPVGIDGELYVSGRQVSSGYLGREELTAERFREHGEPGGERLYRTGDRCQWMGDGRIRYRGRMDEQVKIRGYRVEPGEVERVLGGLPGVETAVVLARRGSDGQTGLIGFVVSVEEGEWREQLEGLLPAYMLPERIMRVEGLPVTSNGKIDRKELSKLAEGESGMPEYIAPRNETEEKLVRILQEIFDDKSIGVRHNFFEAGGNSLKAISLLNRLGKEGYPTTLDDILQYPVAEHLALRLNKVSSTEEEKTNDALSLTEPDGLFPLSYNQQAYFQDDEIVHAQGTIMLVLEEFDKHQFVRALEKTIDGCPALRTRFCVREGTLFQQVLPVGDHRYTIEYQYGIDPKEEAMDHVLGEFLKKEFDLLHGETLRCGILEHHSRAYILISIHHIVTDHLSNDRIRNCLVNYYEGREVPLPADHPARFVSLQRAFLESPAGKRKADFWRDQLSSLAKGQRNHPDGAREVRNRAVIGNTIFLTGERLDRLRAFCFKEDLFLSTLILGALVVMAGSPEENGSGRPQDEFVIEMIVQGEGMDIPGFDSKRSIGQFTNSLPLKFRHLVPGLSADWQFFKDVQRNYLNSLRYREVPALCVKADFSGSYGFPLRQATRFTFNYVDCPGERYQDSWYAGAREQENVIVNYQCDPGRNEVPPAKCLEYADSLMVAWDWYCTEEQADDPVEKYASLRRFSRIIDSLI